MQDKQICNDPKNEFDVECLDIDDWEKRVKYFTKLDRKEEVYLFIRKSRIQRFYIIGNCFIDADGNK